MTKCLFRLLMASLFLLADGLQAQNVKLANVALGMTETEIKSSLANSAPLYLSQSSDYPEMRYLIAITERESYVFTFIDGKIAGFSVVHLLPPGQLPFLSPGQQPTVAVLRGLIVKQTWAPANVNKGDTWWFSDSSGQPVFNARQCRPESGDAWLPIGPLPAADKGNPSAKSAAGLMKPSVSSYPPNCSVSIHLNQTPAESEDSVVTSVRYQVLDMKIISAVRARHKQD